MISRSPFSGLTAHCTLDPPVWMPMASITFSESVRIAWYSLSVSVIAGATVMESPVWTPMGSRFSMEQTMTEVPRLSHITSISYSFQPSRDSSMSTSWLRLISKPRSTMVLNSSSEWAMPPPEPPSVKPGRTMRGHLPMAFAMTSASFMLWADSELALRMPMLSIVALKRRRSSARLMASALAPMSSTW